MQEKPNLTVDPTTFTVVEIGPDDCRRCTLTLRPGVDPNHVDGKVPCPLMHIKGQRCAWCVALALMEPPPILICQECFGTLKSSPSTEADASQERFLAAANDWSRRLALQILAARGDGN